ncbi:acyl-CoA-binding domain-containing protein 6 isoform X1 [Antennarius striatus]|uniref:acyl-CoA-binding domain-containing protein 6 isoform X1 n=1 Tax=Antennarius striatus TaxID=241820 RepID=UPI0035B30778
MSHGLSEEVVFDGTLVITIMASGSPSSSPDTATGSGTDPARPDTGEPLGGAGSDSDSDLGLDKFDCSAIEMGDRLEGDALVQMFEAAAERVRELVHLASREQLLYLYARFKQVKVGKCNAPKPSFFDFEGQRKWQAWMQLGDMGAEQAMREYISCVNVLDPEDVTASFRYGDFYTRSLLRGVRFQLECLERASNPQQRRSARTSFGGAAVSSLYQAELIREEDKNIFDYCRENNLEYIIETLNSRTVDVNTRDEEGRVLLHWACDRGHKEMVNVLLQYNADINSQDDEGQTALHYASACEFYDIVVLLLESGADPSLKDLEGCLPEEVTESTAISSLLRQYTSLTG